MTGARSAVLANAGAATSHRTIGSTRWTGLVRGGLLLRCRHAAVAVLRRGSEVRDRTSLSPWNDPPRATLLPSSGHPSTRERVSPRRLPSLGREQPWGLPSDPRFLLEINPAVHDTVVPHPAIRQHASAYAEDGEWTTASETLGSTGRAARYWLTTQSVGRTAREVEASRILIHTIRPHTTRS